MSLEAESKKLRVFLEGVLMPFNSSVAVRTNLENGISASLDLPADDMFFTRFIPGIRVAIFVEISDEIDQQEEHFALLFDGECQDISEVESGSDSSTVFYTLECRSFSSFCKEALFYFMYSAESAEGERTLPYIGQRYIVTPQENKKIGTTKGGQQLERSKKSPTELMSELFFSKTVDPGKYKKIRPTGFKPDDNGMETLLENLLYFFAYIEVDKGHKQGTMKTFRSIFESHQMRRKVYIVDDENTQAELLKHDSSPMFSVAEVLKVVDDHFEGVAGKNQPFVDFILSLLTQPTYGGHFSDILNIALHHAHYFLAEHAMPPMVEDLGPNNYFFKPNIFYVPPPTCNVIFPCDFDVKSMRRAHSAEPTRGTVHFAPFVTQRLKNSSGMANKTTPAPATGIGVQNLTGVKDIVDPSSHKHIERFKGAKSFLLENTAYAGLISAFSVDEAQSDNFYRINSILLERKLGEAAFRGRSCSLPQMRFSPSLLVGSTCAVISDRSMCLGMISQIDHVFSTKSVATNAEITFCRFFNYQDSVSGGGPTNATGSFGGQYVGGKLKDIYKTFLGSDMFPVGNFIESMEPDEMSAASAETMKKLKIDYDKLKPHQRLPWTRKFKKRSYTSEADYFRIMDVTQTNVKNAVVTSPVQYPPSTRTTTALTFF